MRREVELSVLDVRYETYRMRHVVQEARLLVSVMERGIEEALEGVEADGSMILLNGFKRYRCARKLGIQVVPFASLGDDEVGGIVALLRSSNDRSLGILEQARFVGELKEVHGLSLAEIGERVSRSKGWVSMRLGLLREMTGPMAEKVFSGGFPVYSYMYTVRPFMRMNGAKKGDVEAFVEGLSGKKLSVREIELLAQGYFRGPESLREEIRHGNVAVPLERMRAVPQDPEGCTAAERGLLRDLEVAQKYMQRVMGRSDDGRLKTRAFKVQAHLLSAGMLSRTRGFFESLRRLYDRTGQAQGDLPAASRGDERPGDRAAPAHQPECGAEGDPAAGGDAAGGAQRQAADRSGASGAALRRVSGPGSAGVREAGRRRGTRGEVFDADADASGGGHQQGPEGPMRSGSG
jgi:hypothetical protein